MKAVKQIREWVQIQFAHKDKRKQFNNISVVTVHTLKKKVPVRRKNQLRDEMNRRLTKSIPRTW